MLDADLDHQIVVVEYDPGWPQAYERERAAICQALGDLIVDIQHIGSTAIPGLRAKPVIDVLVAVSEFADIAEYARRLEPLGYQHMTHANEVVRIFFRKGLPRTHHLHIVEDGSWEHRRLLLFRNYLLTHPDTADAYESLKRDLAERFAGNRPQYTESKTGFVEEIILLADAENVAREEGALTRIPCQG
jgi:GrpB-like predicted nucleotidyltransferase (UPF0157 family)